jgi:pyridoxal phosphate enzyme (YggS family)
MPADPAAIARVQAAIAAACRDAGRDPATVRLIAVTKSQEPPVLAALMACGIADFGENRLDHLAAMRAAAPPGARFHAIGRVQGRQLQELVAHCAELHSLCDPGHLDRFARSLAEAGFTATHCFPVYVQVNTSGEASKAGLQPDALPAFLDRLRAIVGCRVQGLMTMAPDVAGTDPATVRRCFARCRALADRHGLTRLSMGMSSDFALAIAEGATDVRIGSLLFR